MPSVYATIADMTARFDAAELVQLTDDAGTGEIDDARVQLAIDQAGTAIDAHVSAYYKRIDAALPVPAILTDIACDIARYRLFRQGVPPEHIKTLFDSAMRQLRDIAAGKLKLDLGEETFEARPGMILVESQERHFTRKSMEAM